MSITTSSQSAPFPQADGCSSENASHSGLLILTIAKSLLDIPQDALLQAPALPPSYDSYAYLLSGEIACLQTYAGLEHSAWLLDIAHDICDPCHKRGALFVFVSGPWRPVLPSDPLVATTYTYFLASGIALSLTNISERRGKSMTSEAGDEAGLQMRLAVARRDEDTCWITGGRHPRGVTNCHILPKRMGDSLARRILAQFCSDTPAAGLRSIYDAIFGVSLMRNHSRQFEEYNLGFRHVSGETYAVHLFSEADSWTITGMPAPGAPAPLLHGRRANAPNPGHTDNPPAGLFRWHYLQCVLKLFGHADYTGRAGVMYDELPIPKDPDYGDAGSDAPCASTDDEADWPSAAWDRGRLAYDMQQEEQRRQQSISDWVSAVQ
ncbi:hypothetical protein AURDEDRAFT_63515 [Auricularia subglabra TFB-10046 SS5]|nr:hypothetical protein AURDEDRAFT_63515 [Auricularia subglabra TFB-10046 SS5]